MPKSSVESADEREKRLMTIINTDKITISQLKNQLEEAGFSAKDLKEAGFSISDLKVSFSASDLKVAGYTAKELKVAGFATGYLKEAEFSAIVLNNKDINVFNICELINAGFNASDLKKAFFEAKELKEAGFSAQKLKEAGFTDLDKDLKKDICIDIRPSKKKKRTRRFIKNGYNIYYKHNDSYKLMLDLGKVIDLNNIYIDGYGSKEDGEPDVIKIYNGDKNECMLYNGHIYDRHEGEIKGKGKKIFEYLLENGLLADNKKYTDYRIFHTNFNGIKKLEEKKNGFKEKSYKKAINNLYM